MFNKFDLKKFFPRQNRKNHKNNRNGKPQKIFEMRLDLNLKNFFLWGFILLMGLSFLLSFQKTGQLYPVKTLTSVLTDIKENKVDKITIEGDRLTVDYKNDTHATTTKETQDSLIKILEASGINPQSVALEVKDAGGAALWLNIISNVLPLVFMVAFFFFIFRQARGAQDTLFSFGQSRARLFSKDKPKVRFSDVAGVDEAKKELEEVVDFLKNPAKYRSLGARTPKGVLLVGPSGTGKTLLARALAGEANVPFFSMAGSEFMEMLVGVGASRVRDLFATAKKNAPSIIFIDEIDAIGRMRSTGLVGGHDEREQTLNQILVEMDGFEPNTAVMVVAATNRGDMLDPALLRPGRFDRRVVLDLPDIAGRKAILAIHAKGKPFSSEVDWEKAAKRTVGFSGADLENMLNEAAITAARLNKSSIDFNDIEDAALKVKLGPEKKRLQSKQDRLMTAYHEAGHALVAYNMPNMDPVHRISIVSRGMALGFTIFPPQFDRVHETKTRLLEQIATMLGGRASEEIVFQEMTSGAANDIDKATAVAREMVIEFGMSALGPMDFGPRLDIFEYGRSFYEQQQLSPEMLSKIDREIKKIIDSSYQKAKEIVSRLRDKLDLIAEELVKKETIEGEEFEKLIGMPRPQIAAAKV